MCGIAGIVGENANEAILNKLLLPIAHRGESRYRNEMLVLPGMAIGTHRLAIVDEASGRQPVRAENEKVFCVFNGEIYNHAELRRQLISDKQFTTECDSEVVLQAYLKWGDEFVQHLDGKYGIAIYDQNKRTLTLARDPMGIKPLYYAEIEDGWVFSSELKSLVALGNPSIDIVELDPGSIWKNGNTETYFKLKKFSKNEIRSSATSDYVPKLKDCLTKAVRKRIPSESSRIACLLSGGVDSAIITYLARQIHPKVVAYTLAAPHMPSADLNAAKTLCEQLDIEHVIVSPQVQDMQQFYLEEGVYMTESFEPVLVRNAVSYHFLCRQVVSDGFKYCLNGEGADELFGGYDFVREAPIHLQDDVIWHSLSIIHKTYLQMADRASMYATLEARVPYMDKDLIEFCLALPPHARVNTNNNKILLRETFKKDLPESITNRRKTGMNEGAGFGINASKESIYHQAVQTYYESQASKFEEDVALCKKEAEEGKLDLTQVEEVYNFAKFVQLNYTKLRKSQNRLQLNTKLNQKLVEPLSKVSS
jgi:asparagine synthase (glutamine-hydrolysing)